MKRISLVLIVIAVMALGAINASACVICRYTHPFEDGGHCVYVNFDNADSCTWINGCCEEVGECTIGAAQASLAEQYTIASVERLDKQRVLTATNAVKTRPSSSKLSQNR